MKINEENMLKVNRLIRKGLNYFMECKVLVWDESKYPDFVPPAKRMHIRVKTWDFEDVNALEYRQMYSVQDVEYSNFLLEPCDVASSFIDSFLEELRRKSKKRIAGGQK